jgi:hypothetical protein
VKTFRHTPSKTMQLAHSRDVHAWRRNLFSSGLTIVIDMTSRDATSRTKDTVKVLVEEQGLSGRVRHAADHC